MNIKSIPTLTSIGTVKETQEGSRGERAKDEEGDTKASKRKPKKREATTDEAEMSPEDSDAQLAATQPTSSESVVELLSEMPENPTPPRAGFPTHPKASGGPEPVKKLNRTA